MTQSDDDFRPPHGMPPTAEGRGLCRVCRVLTATRELIAHGAQCSACYEAYRIAPQPRPDVGSRGDSRSWAAALKRREEAGEPLTEAQRTMWREAYRPPRDDHVVSSGWEDEPCR